MSKFKHLKGFEHLWSGDLRQEWDADTKNVLFNVIDTYIQNFKTKQAFR